MMAMKVVNWFESGLGQFVRLALFAFFTYAFFKWMGTAWMAASAIGFGALVVMFLNSDAYKEQQTKDAEEKALRQDVGRAEQIANIERFMLEYPGSTPQDWQRYQSNERVLGKPPKSSGSKISQVLADADREGPSSTDR